MANYKATITGNAIAESKEKHTPSIHLQLRIEQDLDTKEALNKTLYADLWLSEKAKQNTVNTLRAIGYEGNSIAELNTPCLVGYEVEVSTYFEEYNGNSYEKVNFINAVGSYEKRGVKALDDNKARELEARYGALFRSTKATSKASINKSVQQNASATASAPAAPTYDEDDDSGLPF